MLLHSVDVATEAVNDDKNTQQYTATIMLNSTSRLIITIPPPWPGKQLAMPDQMVAGS